MKRILPILFILILGCEKRPNNTEIEEIKIISQGHNTKHKGVDLYILQNFTDEEITITVYKKTFTKVNKYNILKKIEELEGVKWTKPISDNEIVIKIDMMQWLPNKEKILDLVVNCDHKCRCYLCQCKHNIECLCEDDCYCTPACPTMKKKDKK